MIEFELTSNDIFLVALCKYLNEYVGKKDISMDSYGPYGPWGKFITGTNWSIASDHSSLYTTYKIRVPDEETKIQLLLAVLR